MVVYLRMLLQLSCCRFQKKVCRSAHSLPVHQFLIAFLRLRHDLQLASKPLYIRVLKRLTHVWCQAVERDMEKLFQSTCPDCTMSAKYHPFQRSSRRKGNKSLSMALVNKFQARPGGYISLKYEDSLKSLGLVSQQSQVANKTAAEFCCRMLSKTASWLYQKCHDEGERVLNFSFDAAMVGEESVPLVKLSLFGYFSHCFISKTAFFGTTITLKTQSLCESLLSGFEFRMENGWPPVFWSDSTPSFWPSK